MSHRCSKGSHCIFHQTMAVVSLHCLPSYLHVSCQWIKSEKGHLRSLQCLDHQLSLNKQEWNLYVKGQTVSNRKSDSRWIKRCMWTLSQPTIRKVLPGTWSLSVICLLQRAQFFLVDSVQKGVCLNRDADNPQYSLWKSGAVAPQRIWDLLKSGVSANACYVCNPSHD